MHLSKHKERDIIPTSISITKVSTAEVDDRSDIFISFISFIKIDECRNLWKALKKCKNPIFNNKFRGLKISEINSNLNHIIILSRKAIFVSD